MLHPNAKERLRRVCPTEFDIEWHHPHKEQMVSTTVECVPQWKELDDPIEYPVIAMELSPEAMPRWSFGDDESEDEIRVDVPEDDSIAYERYIGKPVYAELHITVAVDTSKNGIPAPMIADKIASDIWFEYEYNTEHLQRQGTTGEGEPIDYEWPMNVYQPNDDGIYNMNQRVDQQAIQRRTIPFRVDYRIWRYEEVPSTQKLGIEYGLDKDYDGERETTEKIYVDLYDDEWLDGSQ